MSADRIHHNPYTYRKFKLICYHCGKEITNLDNITEGHELCIEEQSSCDSWDTENLVMRLDFCFTRPERKPRKQYSDKLIREWKDICEAGFIGSMEDYIEYKNSFNKHTPVVKDNRPFSDDDIPF